MRIKNKQYAYKVAFNAALGSAYFGYQVVNISSIATLIDHANDFNQQSTAVMSALLIAVLPFSAIMGVVMLPKLIAIFKAIKLMIMIDILSIIFMIGETTSISFYNLILWRFGIGFTVGINSGFIPQYINSISPKSISTSMCSLTQVMSNFAMAFCYLLSLIVDQTNLNDHIGWRIILLFPVFILMIRSSNLILFYNYQMIGLKLNPIQQLRIRQYLHQVYEDSSLAFQKLFKQSQPSQQENHTIVIESNTQVQRQKQRIELKQLIICCVLACSNQFSGINSIVYYGKQFFLQITQQQLLSVILIVMFSLIQTVSSMGGGLLSDKVNKKKSLIVGQLLLIVILVCVFVFQSFSIIVIIMVFLHSFIYRFFIGQLFGYYVVNLLDSPRRGFIVNWIGIFIITLNTKQMINTLGIGWMCLMFAILLSLCLLLIIIFIPSDQKFGSLKTPLKSTKKINHQLQLSTNDNSSINQQIREMV